MEMDLIFATFPAFFAGAWLCARTRGLTVAALGLAALAHGSFWFVVRSDDFGPHSVPVVRVRWVETLGGRPAHRDRAIAGPVRRRIQRRVHVALSGIGCVAGPVRHDPRPRTW